MTEQKTPRMHVNKKKSLLLEEMCFNAFGAGGHYISHKGSEGTKAHQGVKLVGFDGARFILDATISTKEDRGSSGKGLPASLSVDDVKRKVQLLQQLKYEDSPQAVETTGQHSKSRRVRLAALFAILDYDKGGTIEASDLMRLGKAQARQRDEKTDGNTNAKKLKWTEVQNRQLVAKMDTSGDGLIDEQEYINFCDQCLPKDTLEFSHLMSNWEDAATRIANGELLDEDLDGGAPESQQAVQWREEYRRRVEHILQHDQRRSEVRQQLDVLRADQKELGAMLQTLRDFWKDLCTRAPPSTMLSTEVNTLTVLSRLTMPDHQHKVGQRHLDAASMDLQQGLLQRTVSGFAGLLDLFLHVPSFQAILPGARANSTDPCLHSDMSPGGPSPHSDVATKLQALQGILYPAKAIAEGKGSPHHHGEPSKASPGGLAVVSLHGHPPTVGERVAELEATANDDPDRLGVHEVKQLIEDLGDEMAHLHCISVIKDQMSAETQHAQQRVRYHRKEAVEDYEEFVSLLDQPPWCHLLPLHAELIKPELQMLHERHLAWYRDKAEEAEQRMQRLREVYRAFDHDGSGTIEASELRNLGGEWSKRQKSTQKRRGLRRKKKVRWTEAHTKQMITKMDSSGDGIIDEEEFVTFCSRLLPGPHEGFFELTGVWIDIGIHAAEVAKIRKETLHEVYRAFDWDNSGFIEAGELLKLGEAISHRHGRTPDRTRRGPSWTPEQNAKLVQAMDLSGDHRISRGEFINFCCKLLPSDDASFQMLCELLMQIAHEAKARALQIQRESDKTAAAKPTTRKRLVDLPKYGVVTSLHTKQEAILKECSLKNKRREDLVLRQQRWQETMRRRGQQRRTKALEMQREAAMMAKAWQEDQKAKEKCWRADQSEELLAEHDEPGFHSQAPRGLARQGGQGMPPWGPTPYLRGWDSSSSPYRQQPSLGGHGSSTPRGYGGHLDAQAMRFARGRIATGQGPMATRQGLGTASGQRVRQRGVTPRDRPNTTAGGGRPFTTR